MPRYMVERSFPQGLEVPMNADGRKALDGIIVNNADLREAVAVELLALFGTEDDGDLVAVLCEDACGCAG